MLGTPKSKSILLLCGGQGSLGYQNKMMAWKKVYFKELSSATLEMGKSEVFMEGTRQVLETEKKVNCEVKD